MTGQHDTRPHTACGAFLSSDKNCLWRVWAPAVRELALVLFDGREQRTVHSMVSTGEGYFCFQAADISEGQRYAYLVNSQVERPDPASRWQPDGVHLPSAVWNPHSFTWTDQHWEGTPRANLVFYELHVGTFTPEGTFSAIIERLEQLRDLGITAIELMPVAQFPGRRNWGYDGTGWYAVQSSYGGPRELQRLVNACHQVGMSVFLDVVYNHLGPEGNYLADFGPYFKQSVTTPWGAAINYDEAGSQGVRDFVLNNVRHWIRDFHLDGLRLDATHAIHDCSDRHILAEIQAVAAAESAIRGNPCHIIAESDQNDARQLLHTAGAGWGLDAQWNDDFHHCVHTLLTHERNGYYQDYQDPLPQLAKVINHGFAYDGNFSTYRNRPHGAPVDNLTGDRFIVSVQNHDQIGNRAQGDRLSQLVPFNGLRLSAALLLLSPYLPLLFMGEEYGESNPFPFFCDFGDPALRQQIHQSRQQEFADFEWPRNIPNPLDAETFASAKLTWEWWSSNKRDGLRLLYRDLLRARREWPALRNLQHREAHLVTATHGEVLLKIVRGDPQHPSEQIEAYFNPNQSTVVLPAMSAPRNHILLSTEDLKYGGWKRSGRRGWDMSPLECIVVGRQHEPTA